MFAVIRTGGKQYRVAPNDIIKVEKIAGEPGDIVELAEVILLGGVGGPKPGSPTVAGAMVAAEVISQTRADKIVVFKKKRRKNYRRKKGHRQLLTALRITEILPVRRLTRREVRQGRWQLLDCRRAWADNPTGENFIASLWQAA